MRPNNNEDRHANNKENNNAPEEFFQKTEFFKMIEENTRLKEKLNALLNAQKVPKNC